MRTLENTIDADNEALQMFAKDFRNVSVVHKSYGETSPFRWELQISDPRAISRHDRTDRSADMPARAQQKKASPAQVSAHFGGSGSRSLVNGGNRSTALAERVARAINDRSLLKPRRAKTALADALLRLDATLGPFLTVTAGVTNGVWAMNVHTKRQLAP